MAMVKVTDNLSYRLDQAVRMLLIVLYIILDHSRHNLSNANDISVFRVGGLEGYRGAEKHRPICTEVISVDS